MLLQAGQEGGRTCSYVWNQEQFERHMTGLQKEGGADVETTQRDLKYGNAVCFFLKHGCSDAVVSKGGVGQMQYQSEGSRLIAMCNLSECMDVLSKDLQETVQII